MERTKEQQVVAVPKKLVQRIKKVVAGRLGYVTVSEYVREAIRRKLTSDEYELDKLKLEEEALAKARAAYEKME